MSKFKDIKQIVIEKPLELDCGQTISNFPLAYETYGKLNDDRSNAILIFHALTGDQFASGINPITKKDGWWNYALGPGKAIDTDKYFVIAANVIGGCMGSFGPSDINPETKKGMSFQRHFQRNEIWFVSKGKCQINFSKIDAENFQSIELNKEQVFHVEKEAWHQITNPFDEPCHIIEIQYGEKTDEEDIERLRFYDNEN